MNPRMALGSLMSPTLAHTTATCAVEPLVIHILAPFSVQPSLVSLATVIMPAGLDPKSGSVSPKQPIALPLASCGSHSFFCASDPKAKMGYITRAPCTDAKDRM